MNASDMDDGLPRFEDQDPQSAPHSSGKVSPLVLGLAFAAALVLGGMILVGESAHVTADRPQACVGIDNADLRLSCYDETVHRPPPQPARGATAIVN